MHEDSTNVADGFAETADADEEGVGVEAVAEEEGDVREEEEGEEGAEGGVGPEGGVVAVDCHFDGAAGRDLCAGCEGLVGCHCSVRWMFEIQKDYFGRNRRQVRRSASSA